LFYRGSLIESTTLPIPLLLEQCQLPIAIGNVIVSIGFESQIPKLPISALGLGLGLGGGEVVGQRGRRSGAGGARGGGGGGGGGGGWRLGEQEAAVAVALAGHQVVAAAAEALGGEAVAGGRELSLVLAAVRGRLVEVGGGVQASRQLGRRVRALARQQR